MPVTAKHLNAIISLTANATVVIAGNNTVSNVTSNSSQIVASGTIRQIFHGASSNSTSDGYWVVKRGSNTVAVLTETGHQNYAGMGLALSQDKAANVVCELVGTTNGYIIIEVSKELIG